MDEIMESELKSLKDKAEKYDNLMKIKDTEKSEVKELVIEQVPKKPKLAEEENQCGECGAKFLSKPNNCPECDVELEWDSENGKID